MALQRLSFWNAQGKYHEMLKKKLTKQKNSVILKIVRNLNSEIIVVRYYIDKESGELYAESRKIAWFYT